MEARHAAAKNKEAKELNAPCTPFWEEGRRGMRWCGCRPKIKARIEKSLVCWWWMRPPPEPIELKKSETSELSVRG